LVVDDDESVRKTVVAQIASFGYSTIEAGAAAKALRIIDRNEPFDLLFTDVGGMSGIDLVKAARERKRDLKYLLTSGFPDLKTRHDDGSFASGEILSKPYRRGDLQSALRAILNG
jgi:DNA-binding NtrC family response regulator